MTTENTHSEHIDLSDVLTWDDRSRYKLLDRLRTDCEYYLGYGNRHPKYLWAGREEGQIEAMKALWNSFPETGKPEWLPYSKILQYEQEMVRGKASLSEQIQAAAEKCTEQPHSRNNPTKEAERE